MHLTIWLNVLVEIYHLPLLIRIMCVLANVSNWIFWILFDINWILSCL